MGRTIIFQKIAELGKDGANVISKKALGVSGNVEKGIVSTGKLNFSIRKEMMKALRADRDKFDQFQFAEKVGDKEYIIHTVKFANDEIKKKYGKGLRYVISAWDNTLGHIFRWVAGRKFRLVDPTEFPQGKIDLSKLSKTNLITKSNSRFATVSKTEASKIKTELDESISQNVLKRVSENDKSDVAFRNLKKDEGFEVINGKAIIKKDAVKAPEGDLAVNKAIVDIHNEMLGENSDAIHKTIMDTIGSAKYAEVIDKVVQQKVIGGQLGKSTVKIRPSVHLTEEASKALGDKGLKGLYESSSTNEILSKIKPEHQLKFDLEVNKQLITEYLKKDTSGEGLFNIKKAATEAK